MGQTPLELAQRLGFNDIRNFIEKQTAKDDCPFEFTYL
jgi:hypothetical protein